MDGLLLTTETEHFFKSVGISNLRTLGNVDVEELEDLMNCERVMAGVLRKDILAVHAKAISNCSANEKAQECGQPSAPEISPVSMLPSVPNCKTFVLSLRRRKDRRDCMYKLLETFECKDFVFVEALDGRSLCSREGSSSKKECGDSFELSWRHDEAIDPAWAARLSASSQMSRDRGAALSLPSREAVVSVDSAASQEGFASQTRSCKHLVRIRVSRTEPERWCVLACLLGHAEIMRRVKEEGCEHALVLEDDCVAAFSVNEFRNRWAAGFEVFGPQPALVYLGGKRGFMRRGQRPEALDVPLYGGELLTSGEMTYQSHAYFLSADAVPTIEKFLQRGFAADAALVQAAKVFVSGTWRFSPSLLVQRNNRWDSDINPQGVEAKESRERPASPSGQALAPPFRRRWRRRVLHDHTDLNYLRRAETPGVLDRLP